MARWAPSGGAERSNYGVFLTELCDVLGVARPDPAGPDDRHNAYVFDRHVTFNNGDGTTSAGFIDLYKRGCFVLEAKQGTERQQTAAASGDGLPADPAPRRRRGTATRGTAGWDGAMLAARGQADRYARALPADEGWPPFLVVVDVGFCIELFADFSRSGRTYVPFPDVRGYRVPLRDLVREDVRERLRLVWTDPLALDPSRYSARITRAVAEKLAVLARSLEASGNEPGRVAQFLMRCIFTMFAEDVRLLKEGAFTGLLADLRERNEAAIFPEMVRALWQTMDTGGFSPVLRQTLPRFNGGLFADADALPLSAAQLDLLIAAGRADWRDVEPAIFGTLLERALDPRERHKLGAHYTPRAYVERLVLPTVIEPLRAEWQIVQAAGVTLAQSGDLAGAAREVETFHRTLCRTRVLDPACGSGNFLYVTLEHLKRLEGEVLLALAGFGRALLEYEEYTVDPQQLLGIEVNPRAAAIADLVLWIGYLQWHFRTRGDALPREPVLKSFHNIVCRDAVLAWDAVRPVLDAAGNARTRWDGRTMKPHAVTGEPVPDETVRAPVVEYVNPRKADWPEADYLVGNPPFLGNWRMRSALGDGYTEALRTVYAASVPESSDYVMYWWDRAAELARAGQVKRFGLITTNSLRQTNNRRVVQSHLAPAS